ncbi:9366_t:CDS:2, partial [Dentiscutata heterogama]
MELSTNKKILHSEGHREKINRVIYAENSNKVNNTSKRTYKEISDEDPEVHDNEDDCEDDYEDDDENEDEDVDEDDDENKGEDDNKDKKAKERKKLEKKFVEDVLYDWAVTHRSETLAHSFILDTDCQEVMDLFSPEEKETILNTNKKSFPAVQDDIKKYVMKYYKKNVDDLRETVMEPYLKNGETYNSKLHYDLEWIHLVFNKFVIEWEQGVNALAEDNLEAWIVSHVWTFIVDMALKDIEENGIRYVLIVKENTKLKARVAKLEQNQSQNDEEKSNSNVLRSNDASVSKSDDDTRGIEQSTVKTISTKMENSNDTPELMDLQTKDAPASDITNN